MLVVQILFTIGFLPTLTIPCPDPLVFVQVNLKRLSSGLLALAFNDHQRPVVAAPEEGAQETLTRARRRLSVALSEDGEEWVRVAHVDDQSAGSSSALQLHYPSILERDESTLVIGAHTAPASWLGACSDGMVVLEWWF